MTPTACAKEMLPYAGPLHTAPNGKRGYLYMGFELDGNGNRSCATWNAARR